MSGKCARCGDHCLECRCSERNDMEIKIWAQMFFEDGSVSQGVRIPAQWLDDDYAEMLEITIANLLSSTNREQGWILLWGAGNMIFKHYPISFLKLRPLEESDS